MAKLIYIINASLDGYIEDADGDFQWTQPCDAAFAFITDLIRPIGTHLLGRRMYEMMAVWETEPAFAAESELMADFARVWQGSEKVVHSTSLHDVWTTNTRLERTFDADAVRQLKASASADIAIAGPNLAAQAFTAGLVDEVHLFVCPLTVGSGKPAFPTDLRVDLELLDHRSFTNGTTYLRYQVS